MNAIEESREKINGEPIQTFRRKVEETGTLLEVEAGTNGFKGTSCRKGGSRSYLKLIIKAGDMMLTPVSNQEGHVIGIEIATSGDAALIAITKALLFVSQVFDDQIGQAIG